MVRTLLLKLTLSSGTCTLHLIVFGYKGLTVMGRAFTLLVLEPSPCLAEWVLGHAPTSFLSFGPYRSFSPSCTASQIQGKASNICQPKPRVASMLCLLAPLQAAFPMETSPLFIYLFLHPWILLIVDQRGEFSLDLA